MFQGSMVALVTPMEANGDIDYDNLAKLVDFHIENKSDALVVVGTTGESATINEKDHCKLIKFVVDHCKNRVPVIAGTGANSTDEAVQLTQCAQDNGADAALLVTPYYNKPTQEGLYQHYKYIANAVALPQILYNVPGRTAIDMLPETVFRLAEISNIMGIKEATGDIDRIRHLVTELDDKMNVYTGDDATAMEAILAGAKGDISVTANIAPKLMHEMCLAALNNDRETAQAINEKLDILHKNLFIESNPIPVKWALFEMGYISQGIRLPLTVLDKQYHETIRQSLSSAGIQF
ncbi:MAG: 4-hydroxy-tetrahydrodipicolinate synthase [Pseudomonadota bacterium]